MRFRPAPLSFWANVITVGMLVPLAIFIWMGFANQSGLALLFFFLTLLWAFLLAYCWAIATLEYRIDNGKLTIQPHLGHPNTYEILGVDDIAMKRQPLRRAFASRVMGTYGPFGFHGNYRTWMTRPVAPPGGRSKRRLEIFQVACTTLQHAIYVRTKAGVVVVTPKDIPAMLRAIGEIKGEK
jgi:hypothetical protein